MGTERCPSCAAAVRKDSDWCTLCYADLRPAPAPVQRAAYPQPSPTVYAAASAVSAPGFAPSATPASAGADALHAPYEHVLAAAYGAVLSTSAKPIPQPDPGAPVAEPALRTGWPFSQCSELNDFESMKCSICGSPFGGSLQADQPVVDRKRVMMYAIGAMVAFLLLVAAFTFAATKSPPADPGYTEIDAPVETTAPQQPTGNSDPPADPAASTTQ